MPRRKGSGISVTDFFCGAGGSSQGARRLGLDVQLAVNHWELAIGTHSANFPETEHDCADLREVHPERYWPTNILIACPECTEHSIAKGRKRRTGQRKLFEEYNIDPEVVRSRATMWTVPDYAEHMDYEVIIVENVVDARKWRPWDGWLMAMHRLGYEHDVVYFNSMFAHMEPLQRPQFGDFAPQSRDRMYVVFWKKGNKKPDLEIRPKGYCWYCEKDVEAVQSWKKQPGEPFWRWGRYRVQYVYRCPKCREEVVPYYYAAANAIDWGYPIERIGDRDRPLKERTLDRIRRGLEKFANQYLVVDLAHPSSRARPATKEGFTQTGAQTIGLLAPFVLNTLHGELVRQVSEELPTQTARQSLALAMPFLSMQYTPGYSRSLDDPLATVTAQDHHGLVIPFITSVNHSTDRSRPVTDTLATQMPQARNSVVIPPFIVKLRNNQDAASLQEELSTITAGGRHHGLLMPFLMSYYGTENVRDVAEGMGTLTTKDRHALVEQGGAAVPDVEDCYFRMLQPHEIGRGMAFDDGYAVLGNKRQQVKQYGQAVTPPVMELLCQRAIESLE